MNQPSGLFADSLIASSESWADEEIGGRRGHYEQAGVAQAKRKLKKSQPLRRRELGGIARGKMAKTVVERPLR